MTRLLNLVGHKYGKLTVLNYTKTNEKNGMRYFNCLCDCGKYTEVTLGNLRSGHTVSCGCARPVGEGVHNYKHGFKITDKVYKAWCKIRERCYNPNDISYATYGAVGIKLSDEFYTDFLKFYNEIGEPPCDGQKYSVDRIDHTKGYESGNIRWATDKQQARNKGKMKNNTSGFTGVLWDIKPWPDGTSRLYAKAIWYSYSDDVKKIKSKCYRADTYGLLESFALACAYREQMIKKLNDQGYGYTENHGK